MIKTVLAGLLAFAFAADVDQKIPELLNQDRDYATLPADVFNAIGWDLPDGGRAVKALADAAPGGAFDPKKLETLSTDSLGYRAKWHVVRYKYYGLDWDITGLQLTPNKPEADLPTLAIINGGSANFYEFFVDPLNRPGIGQYLAQRMPVMLITIPGNYADGGWSNPKFDERIPAYVLGQAISKEEAGIRNAIYTFSLVTEGVRQLLEQTTTGPLLIWGHSTGGEMQFLLKESSLKNRLNGRSIGFGTGGPAFLTKQQDEMLGVRAERVETYGKYPRVDVLRARDAAGYVSSGYIGPLNPSKGGTPLDVAKAWFQAEGRRRPQFKQTLQDIEHQGFTEHRARMEKEIREILAGNKSGIKADDVIRDLFSTMSPPMKGYRRMAWVVGSLDDGHWNATPEKAREWNFAKSFRQQNPGAAIRVLMIAAPVTHYTHIERPKQLAAVLAATARWVEQDDNSAGKNPFGADAASVELGRLQFRMACAGCHGLRATGGRSGPDLTRGTFAAGNTEADLYRVISDGVPGTEMPSFNGRLEDDDRWRLVSYVHSLSPHDTAPIPGDPAAGEKLFWEKGNCGQCHRVGTRGGSLGPNLSRSGRQRSLSYLRESVVSPDADVTSGYATITVVTRDGKKITGVERGFDNFSAQLMDVAGRYYSFQKDAVTSLQREYRSLMPSNYSRVFSARELDDLLAFLAGLGGQ